MRIRLETRGGKLIAELEIPDAPIAPGVIEHEGAHFAKISGQPAFNWQPLVFRETTILHTATLPAPKAQTRAA